MVEVFILNSHRVICVQKDEMHLAKTHQVFGQGLPLG